MKNSSQSPDLNFETAKCIDAHDYLFSQDSSSNYGYSRSGGHLGS